MRVLLTAGAVWLGAAIVLALAVSRASRVLTASRASHAPRTASSSTATMAASVPSSPEPVVAAVALSAVAVSLHGLRDNAVLARETTNTLADGGLSDEGRSELTRALAERTELIVHLLDDIIEWAPTGLLERLERATERPLPTLDARAEQPAPA